MIIKKIGILALTILLSFSLLSFSATDFQFTNDKPQNKYQEDSNSGDINDISKLKDFQLLQKMKADFLAQKKVNSDTTGWLNMPNIGYYPIMSDSEKDDGKNTYLSHGPDKQPLKRGSLFLSALSNRSFDDTALIYGHHMASGRMFGCLKKYKDSYFFKQNKSIIIFDGKIYRVYKPFSAYLIEDNGYHAPKQGDWGSSENRSKYIRSLKSNSIVKSSFNPNTNGDIAYFWTCDYDFDGARLIVAASVIQTIPANFSKQVSILNIPSS